MKYKTYCSLDLFVILICIAALGTVISLGGNQDPPPKYSNSTAETLRLAAPESGHASDPQDKIVYLNGLQTSYFIDRQ